MLDAQGGIRDLSGVVEDLAGAALSAQGLEHLRALGSTKSIEIIDVN